MVEKWLCICLVLFIVEVMVLISFCGMVCVGLMLYLFSSVFMVFCSGLVLCLFLEMCIWCVCRMCMMIFVCLI